MASAGADSAFWGRLPGRVGDLTLKFQESVLDLAPSCLLLVLAPVAAISYLQQPVHVRRSPLLWIKLIVAAVSVGIEIASLSFRSASHVIVTETTLPAASLDLIAALVAASLLYVEHRRAIRSSALLGLYFFVRVVFEAVKCRSFFSRPGLAPVGALAAASCGVHLVLLTLQEVSKRELLIDPALQESLGEEGTAGFWKRMLFTYLNPMFIAGFRNVLCLQDLDNIGPEFSSALLHSKLKQHLHGVRWKSKNTLLRICFEAWMWLLLLALVPRVFLTGFSFSQPFILRRAIESLDDPDATMGEATLLLCATFLSFAGATLSKMATKHLSYRIVTRLRGALVTQLSEKNARLPQSEAKKSSAITLMSTDVDGIANGLPSIYELVMTFFEVGLGIYFLSGFVGQSCFMVLVPLVASTCVTYFLGRSIGSAYQAWNQSIEARVAKTSTVLSQLKAIKMLGMGPVIGDYLQHLRQAEMIKSNKFRILEAVASIPVICAELITPVVVIAAALFWHTLGGRLSAAAIFPSLSIIILIKTPLALLLSAYPTMTSMFRCFRRIQEFLQLSEREDPRTLRESPDMAPLGEKADPANPTTWPIVEFVGAKIAPPGTQIPILSGVSFCVYPGSVTLAIGPNGAGKSLLLQTILGETSLIEGAIYIDSISMGFCGQLLWLQNVSIRDNIIGYLPFDERLYRRVLHCCLLEEDIAALPEGENYIVGSGGSKLSGGQRQRVALARALFARMSVIVLDDVFSSLDRRTATSILLRLCGKNGLLRELHTAAVLSSYLPECLDVADQLLELDGHGGVRVESNFRSGGSRERALRIMNVSGRIESEEAITKEQAELRRSLDAQQPEKTALPGADLVRKGDASLYWLFIDPIGRIRLMIWCVAMFFCSAGEMFPDIYMRLWIERHPDDKTYFIGYASIAVATCFLFALTCAVLFAYLIPRTALGLHHHLVQTLMRATLGFLGVTDNGVLINRFSQDMSLVARKLPLAFMRTFYVFFTALIQSGIVVSGANYMAAVLPVVFLAVYTIQWFYLRTSRQMRALDLESSSPLYTHFQETADGLLYIRAFGWQMKTLEQGFHLLDDSQKAFYYMYCIQQWLGLVLGLLIAVVATTLMAFVLFMKGSTSQTALGLAFLNLILLAQTLEHLILAWTSLETSIGALARLRNFMNETPQEPSDRHLQVPENWPSLGHIELQNVSADYWDDNRRPPVLQNLSLSIDGGQRVGLVGRTGSGKSSLFLALLGFLHCKGVITIDGIDISSIPVDVLRSRIVTISQDQIKLDATVRTNLLPFTLNVDREEMRPQQRREAEAKDMKLRELLVRLGIWSHLSDKGGLDAMLDDVGYSHGEMQLFCLARGIMRYQDTGSKVVLIDEATSSVEEERERVVQRIMRDSFPDCTILVIGHRKSSVTGVDFTVELSNGKVAHIDQTLPGAEGWGSE
ncbi:ABC multidrug transporter, putative [Cordyceps militaris CM01]|uniref:ABC multidrug transporter, putative n=1 Tax=Cordyceps militaris (strain CM01) TaxID=983644 RepID=G3JGH2_CORMM|nr:ABC multidrug transporter, putative [Cordyceps militaris CM01]EGX92389.1 ABC multidrug transporter, putative [Cordyceps militaris CM01]